MIHIDQWRSALRTLTIIGVALAFQSCTSSTAPVATASIISVAPAGGATAVATTGSITLTFSDSMMLGSSSYMSLHIGALNGAAIFMTPHWSADHRTLTMTPSAPLASGTTYYMHLGGGMTNAGGLAINYGQCAALGGQSATAAMMGGMMGGMTSEMGPGWTGTDGNYGWVFSFTTA